MNKEIVTLMKELDENHRVVQVIQVIQVTQVIQNQMTRLIR